jgi:beta-lactamase class A
MYSIALDYSNLVGLRRPSGLGRISDSNAEDSCSRQRCVLRSCCCFWPARALGLQAQRPLEPLRRELEARTARHHGVISLAVIDLRSGDTLTVRGHERFPTASVIKLPILVEVFHQMRNGRLHWADPLVMTDADRVPGAGCLQHFRPPHTLTLGDAATLMIALIGVGLSITKQPC